MGPALAAFLCALGASASLHGQASDLIDTSRLGERGAVFLWPLVARRGFEEVTGLGDMNGDGFDDFALVVEESPLDALPTSSLQVVLGRRGLTGRHRLTADFPGRLILRSEFGGLRGAARAGDVDGNGLDDFLVATSGGTVYLVYGQPDLEGEYFLDELEGIVFSSSDWSHEAIGAALGAAGDFNGDGREDLALSASGSPVGGVDNVGVVFLIFDAPGLPSAVDLAEVGPRLPGMVVTGFTRRIGDPERVVGAFVGRDLSAAGDFDGDGFDDLLVETDSHTALLIHGRPDPPRVLDLAALAEGREVEGVTVLRNPTADHGKPDLARLGDFDGDGLPDIALGAPVSHPIYGRGFAQIFLGRPDFPALVDLAGGVPEGLGVSVRAPYSGGGFGSRVARAGDLDSDGYADLAIGAPEATVDGERSTGEAYVVFGGPDLPAEISLSSPFRGIRITGERADDWFADEIAGVGDFNGDGAPDLVVLSNTFVPSSVEEEKPKAYLIYGTGSGPAPLTLLAVEPEFGTSRGGTEVTLRGSGFQEAPEVFFGAHRSPRVTLLSGSELRALTPPGELGPVDVAVTVAGATRRLGGAFEYIEGYPEIDLATLGGRGLVLEGEEDKWIGVSVTFGDLTAGGADDLIVASTGRGGTDWIVSVVHGSPGLSGTIPAFAPSEGITLIRSARGDRGVTVEVPGDVNGDGTADLAVGLEGRGYILFGRPDLPGPVDIDEEVASGGAALIERGDLATSAYVFARAGDLDQDGIGDLALGFPGAAFEAGEIAYVRGQAEWPEVIELTEPGLVLAWVGGSQPLGRLGERLVEAGDVNGDGRLDLLAATASRSPARFYLLYGSEELAGERWVGVDDLVAGWGGVVMDLPDGTASFGLHRAGPGDVDGDGYADLLLGVEGGGNANQGVSYLIRGGPRLPRAMYVDEEPFEPDGVVRFYGAAPLLQAARVGPAGDLNGDGLRDLLIGAPGALDFGDPGHVQVVFGAQALPERVDLANLRGRGLRIDGLIRWGGVEVNTNRPGDLDGDGRQDFAFTERGSAGDPIDPASPPVAGKVYVVYGFPEESSFIRGDSNADGRPDLSDAVFTLRYLFAGGTRPRCLDAADTDDGGKIELTDAVYLLNHLFRGGPRPPPPFPEAGLDPTEDELSCRGF